MTAGAARPVVRAVMFDVGETVVDKSREHAAVARLLGTTPHTFSAVFGATVLAGGGVDAVVRRFDPAGRAGYPSRYAELVTDGRLPPPADEDLYPDTRATLHRLVGAGLRVGVVGNQPPGYGAALRALDLPAHLVATSDEWGLRKPDPAYFHRAVRELLGTDARAGDVVHVGDQLDADVVAALAAGLQAVRVRQGPWGALLHDAAVEARCLAVVDRVGDVTPALLAAPPA